MPTYSPTSLIFANVPIVIHTAIHIRLLHTLGTPYTMNAGRKLVLVNVNGFGYHYT
jgi:hypothetical protein